MTALRSFGVGKQSFEENISNEAKYLSEQVFLLQGESFDPKNLIRNATSNVICQVVFGQRYEYDNPKFRFLLDSFTELNELAGPGGLQLFIPLAKHIQQSVHKRMVFNIENVKGFIETAIADHQEGRDMENPRDYIDVYLNEMQMAEKMNLKSFINRHNLTTAIADIFIAGTETIAATLLWSILFMVTYPEVQERVQEEIDSAVVNSHPKLSDKSELPFTCATLLEIQRIASVVPYGVVHYSGEDTTLAEYEIPKGSVIVSNLWNIHHDPEVWDKPDEFNPERFLDKDGVVQERDELIPFSIGMFDFLFFF